MTNFDPFGHQLINNKLDQIQQTLEWLVQSVRILYKLEQKMAHTLDDVVTQVDAESTVEDSIIALVQGLKTQLDAVLAGGLSPSQQAKVDAIFDKVSQNSQKVADAVTANTPADTGGGSTGGSTGGGAGGGSTGGGSTVPAGSGTP